MAKQPSLSALTYNVILAGEKIQLWVCRHAHPRAEHVMELFSLSQALEAVDCSTRESTECLEALFRDAYPRFHNDVTAVQLLGQKCREEQLFEQAEFFFRRALELDPQSPGAKENLRHLHEKMVDRWHFAMLNDVQRNASFFRAVLRAVRMSRDCTVLDIGSGTGILRYIPW